MTDRNAAEALRGTELFVPRERLPEPEEDEVYVHDLIGLPVHLADGTRLGEIVDVADYGAGDLIDVKVEGRKDTVLIPFASQYVLEADGEKVVVDLPRGLPRRGGPQRELPGHRADAVSRDVPGAARASRSRAARWNRGSGRWRRATSGPPPPTGTGRWTTTRRAAVRAWC